jgi:Notch-like protein
VSCLKKYVICISIHDGDTCFYYLDIDDCKHTPCKNNGTCIDQVNGYTCQCLPGYIGDHCGISWKQLSLKRKSHQKIIVDIRDIRKCLMQRVFF